MFCRNFKERERKREKGGGRGKGREPYQLHSEGGERERECLSHTLNSQCLDCVDSNGHVTINQQVECSH